MSLTYVVQKLWCINMLPHLHIASQLLQVVIVIVSRSDTESGVRFVLAYTGQKIAYRRIGLYVSLHGHSHGGGPHGLSPCLLAYCGNVMAQYSSSYVIMCMR